MYSHRISILTLIAAVMAIVMTACSKPHHFTVKGEIREPSPATVSLMWFTSGEIQTLTAQTTAAGKFEIRGESPDYAVGELRVNGIPVGRVLVRDGETVTVEGANLTDVRLKGGGQMKAVARFLNDNRDLIASGDAGAINKAVEQYVADKGVTPAGAYLLLTLYDTTGHEEEAATLFAPFEADEATAPLMSSFAEWLRDQAHAATESKVLSFNMREAGDSLLKYNYRGQTATMLAFTQGVRGRAELVRAMRGLSDRYPERSLRVIEMGFDPDSASWRRTIEGDTAVNWRRVFVAGGPAAPSVRRLDVPRTPFVIISDSTGAQRYRGADIAAATDTIAALIH